MILPLRVLGRELVKRIASGVATAPICLRTWFLSSSLSASSTVPLLERHEAADPFPLRSCG